MLQRRSVMGFTLVELMITIVVAAILLALAVPSFLLFFEKRQVETAVQDISNFIESGRSLAVKRNEQVGVTWWAENTGHTADFCLGISAAPKAVPCDCRETVATESDFCAVGASAAGAADGMAYRMTRDEITGDTKNFAHLHPATGTYTFDPVRGILTTAPPTGRGGTAGYNFRFHSDLEVADSPGNTLFAVCIFTNRSGQVEIFNDTDEPQRVGPWPDNNACD